MANQWKKNGLLRGERDMLGPIQRRAVQWCAGLNIFYRYALAFIIVVVAVGLFADLTIWNDSLGSFFDYFEPFGAAIVVAAALFPASYIAQSVIERGDPYQTALRDADRILADARNSRGQSASVKRVAPSNGAEFLRAFYHLPRIPISWLFYLVTIAVLAAGYVPHYLAIMQARDELRADFVAIERRVVDAWASTDACDPEWLSVSDEDRLSLFHSVTCYSREDNGDYNYYISLNVDDNAKWIKSINIHIDFDEILTELPDLTETFSYVNSAMVALHAVDDLLDYPDLLDIDYSVGNLLDYQIADTTTADDRRYIYADRAIMLGTDTYEIHYSYNESSYSDIDSYLSISVY